MTNVHQPCDMYFHIIVSCFFDHFRFVSDFRQIPRRNVLKFSRFFVQCFFRCWCFHRSRHRNKCVLLVFFGLLTGTPDRLSRRTQKRTPFHPNRALRATLNGPIRFPQTLFQCPRSRTATLELPWSSRSLTVH